MNHRDRLVQALNRALKEREVNPAHVRQLIARMDQSYRFDQLWFRGAAALLIMGIGGVGLMALQEIFALDFIGLTI